MNLVKDIPVKDLPNPEELRITQKAEALAVSKELVLYLEGLERQIEYLQSVILIRTNG